MDIKTKLILLAILAIFILQAVSLNFIQDDAFISYRYVENFINGRGLVFNTGERVEGYTNFLWIILLSIFANLGINVILASKILGIVSGCVTLILLYKISALVLQRRIGARSLTKKESLGVGVQGKPDATATGLFAFAPPLLLATNSAFAYWSVSGLETVFFVMSVLSSVYFYFTEERFTIISSALSSLIRPEGTLVFAIFIAHKFFYKKDRLKDCLLYILGFTLLLFPYLIFKISYYGDLLPNPFYAKAGLSWEYVQTGLAYFWLFLRHYGLWGVLYLIPLFFYKNLGVRGNLTLLMVYIYTLYIIIIGGDVLSAHRFFMPVAPFLYLFFGFAIMRLSLTLKKKFISRALPISLAIVFSIWTFFVPRDWLRKVRHFEIGLYLKMVRQAEMLKQSFGTNFTLATSTIGAISYYTGTKVIDMLGLTDPHIAKHPEEIPGITSPWREKKFNTQYLLSQDPDVIMFSTGGKPSAPAERALLLNSKFRNNYYRYYFHMDDVLLVVFRRKGEYRYENQLFPDARFVNAYNEALNLKSRKQLRAAARKFEDIFRIGPSNFAWAYDQMALLQLEMGNIGDAKKYAQRAIKMDNYCSMSHFILHKIAFFEKDTATAQREEEEIRRINPELLNAKPR